MPADKREAPLNGLGRWINVLLPILLLGIGNFAYQAIKMLATEAAADWWFAASVTFHQALAVILVVLIPRFFPIGKQTQI